VAAAWRLGRWRLLEAYLARARPCMALLQPDDHWEVRLGELLRAFHAKWVPLLPLTPSCTRHM
jgi:hypothetical protein